MDVTEINTTLELQRAEHYWFTKDDQATFLKKKEGWIVDSISAPVREAFEEYGLIHLLAGTHSGYEHTYLPSLKAVRQAVRDVSLEAGLNIDSRLTRRKYIAYKIGDLPLRIKREKDHWRVLNGLYDALPPILEKYFNSTQEFHSAWYTTDSGFAPHPTRKAAHQAVINWLAQTIAEGK